MDATTVEALLLIAVAFALLLLVVATLNLLTVYPQWRAGYRPWRSPEATDRPFGFERHARVAGVVIAGWPSNPPSTGELIVERAGVRLLAGGRQVWVDRSRVGGVRAVRWWGRTWLIFDAADGDIDRYIGVFFAPRYPDHAIDVLRHFDWPVTERRIGRAISR